MLKRGFLGWLRGERGHCTVAIVPTMEEEDAKRPHREREGLVHEQTRVVNRMKSALIQFGVRNFNPKLRKARVKLETVRTPEGKSLPPNTIAALRRDMERLKIIKEQIKAIEQTRLQQFEQKPEALANRMVYLLVRIYGLGWETADLLVHELLSRTLRDRKAVARYAGLTGSPDESGSKRRHMPAGSARAWRVDRVLWQARAHRNDARLTISQGNAARLKTQRRCVNLVGLDPAIHDSSREAGTWMPGTRPGMTAFAKGPYFIGCFSSRTLTTRRAAFR